MVKEQDKDTVKRGENQGKAECPAQASKVGHSTVYSYCSERLSPCGGLLGLVDVETGFKPVCTQLIRFKEIFEGLYNPPAMGHHSMVYGFIMLLFIGFNRVWHLCEIEYETIHIDIDTTVETVYGNQQGGRKGHNTKNRGKKGFRPVLCFIEETREYFAGKLRSGETMGSEEVGEVIRSFKKYLPGCVKKVVLRGDGEFIGWESVEAAIEGGYLYIFGNKGCKLPFDPTSWYKVRERDRIEYNECSYQPLGWKQEYRFVAMRILEDEPREGNAVQQKLFEDDRYIYRIFVTNKEEKAHKVVEEYDKRADSENLIGEAKREGLASIVSNKFASNYAYFQIVMLSYNIWRSFKMLAGRSQLEQERQEEESKPESKCAAREVIGNTIRIARLKLLFIAAKITGHSNANEVKYSRHDSRVAGLFRFMGDLDERLRQVSPWLDSRRWPSRHLGVLGIKQVAFSP